MTSSSQEHYYFHRKLLFSYNLPAEHNHERLSRKSPLLARMWTCALRVDHHSQRWHGLSTYAMYPQWEITIAYSSGMPYTASITHYRSCSPRPKPCPTSYNKVGFSAGPLRILCGPSRANKRSAPEQFFDSVRTRIGYNNMILNVHYNAESGSEVEKGMWSPLIRWFLGHFRAFSTSAAQLPINSLW